MKETGDAILVSNSFRSWEYTIRKTHAMSRPKNWKVWNFCNFDSVKNLRVFDLMEKPPVLSSKEILANLHFKPQISGENSIEAVNEAVSVDFFLLIELCIVDSFTLSNAFSCKGPWISIIWRQTLWLCFRWDVTVPEAWGKTWTYDVTWSSQKLLTHQIYWLFS